MLNDNLRNLRWKCYTRDGSVEISNYRHNDTVTEQNYFSKDANDRVDNMLIDILEELYYLVAFENIDSDENNMDKEFLQSQLEQKAKRYHALLRLKQFYYTEVQMSIDRINNLCRSGTNWTDKDVFILREIEHLYFELSNGDYLWHWSHFEPGDSYYRPYWFHFEPLMYRFAHKNVEEFKRFNNAIIDLAISSEKMDLKEYNQTTIKQWMEFFLPLRNKEFGLAGEIAWLLFLLSIFQQTCSESERLEWIPFDLSEDWETLLTRRIEQTNTMVENVFGSSIYDMQKDMMMRYSVRPMSSDFFNRKIINLEKALLKLSHEQKYEKVTRYLGTTCNGCVAIMHCNSKRYVALSGSEYTYIYSNVLNKLLGPQYHVVNLNSNVRYYYTKQEYITYGEYKTWKNKTHFNEKTAQIKRMFSCCEKKLLTELYGIGSVNFTIYVKKRVCNLCDQAIKHFEEVQKCNGNIMYPKNSKGSRISTTKFNVVAKAVRDDVPVDISKL